MDEEPLVRVVRGTLTPEETAALLTALSALIVTQPSRSHAVSRSTEWTLSARPARSSTRWNAPATGSAYR